MPEIAVVLVNYNSLPLLEGCLSNLLDQPVELVVVDNASTDGSKELLRSMCPLNLLDLSENTGFAGALNLGIRRTKAPWILSMNPDVLLAADFFQQILAVLPTLPAKVSMLAPKLRKISLGSFLAKETRASVQLDSTGLFLDRARRPYDRGQGAIDQGQFDAKPAILGPCGAAAFYRRSMLEELGAGGCAFDERFFAYYEDVDLAWRARAAGYEAVYIPQAVGWHIRAGADSARQLLASPQKLKIAARAYANRYLVLLKNERFLDFCLDFPWIFGYELARHLFLLFRQRSLLRSGLKLLKKDWRPVWQERSPSPAEGSLREFVARSRKKVFQESGSGFR